MEVQHRMDAIRERMLILETVNGNVPRSRECRGGRDEDEGAGAGTGKSLCEVHGRHEYDRRGSKRRAAVRKQVHGNSPSH